MNNKNSSVPGSIARHCIITLQCRENHGDIGAFEEAVERLRDMYTQSCKGWAGKPVNMHLLMSVERLDDSSRA